MMVLDGNAAAGVLSEVFIRDATAAVTICAGCGAQVQVGGLRAYLGGPGVVLRCVSCEAIQIRIVSTDNQTWIDLQGVRVIHFSDKP